MKPDRDVPSPIDFHDPAQAKAWVEQTVATRPWRPRFFNAFADAMNSAFDRTVDIAELGSGPGHLARAVLEQCPLVARYRALDFSPAMHDLAREHLGRLADRVSFTLTDFRDAEWVSHARGVDAILTLQAAHEVRHRRHLPQLFARAREALRDEGLLLFCDHYAEEGSEKNSGLFVSRDEQPRLIENAGFAHVACVLDHGGMALYSARRADTSSWE